MTPVPGFQIGTTAATSQVDASGNFAILLSVANAGTYTGTANFTPLGASSPTASASVGLTVQGLTPTINLSVTPNPAGFGASVIISGTVTGPNNIQGTGTVAIKVSCPPSAAHTPAHLPTVPAIGCLIAHHGLSTWMIWLCTQAGTTVLGNVALMNGAYEFQYIPTPGTYDVTASYAGAGPLGPATAGPVTLTVNFPNAVVTVALNSHTATPNQQLVANGNVRDAIGTYNGQVALTVRRCAELSDSTSQATSLVRKRKLDAGKEGLVFFGGIANPYVPPCDDHRPGHVSMAMSARRQSLRLVYISMARSLLGNCHRQAQQGQ